MRLVWLVVLMWLACPASAQTSGLHWLPNEGQWDAPVRMRADWAGGVTWLEPDGMNIWVAGEGYAELWDHHFEGATAPSGDLVSHGWRVVWEGASETASHEVLAEAGHRVNMYKGSDPGRWATGLVPETRFKLHDVWPGIDVRIGPRSPGDRAVLPGPGWKEDWIVQPGAVLEDLAIRHEGVDLTLQDDGSLRILLGNTAEAKWGAPYAYQTIDGHVTTVDASYVLEGSTVRFLLGDHDPAHPVVIDPDIVFATYIGATQPNWGFTAAYDDDGRAIGGTALWDGELGTYPTTAGAISTAMDVNTAPFDCGVTVFNPEGTALEYSTVFGGVNLDVPSSIVTDSQGAIFVLGTTGSPDFPVTAGAFDEDYCGGAGIDLNACCHYPGGGGLPNNASLFVLKLAPAAGGSGLESSTYIGGCDGLSGVNEGEFLAYNYGDVFRGEINVDSEDRPWVASVTGAADFPMVNAPYPAYSGGATDAVLFRLSSDLSTLEWSTFLGGSGADAAYGVQFTPAGEAVVCGGTTSGNFPVPANGQDTSFGGWRTGLSFVFPSMEAPRWRARCLGPTTTTKPISSKSTTSAKSTSTAKASAPRPSRLARTTRVRWPGNTSRVSRPSWTLCCGTPASATPATWAMWTSARRRF